MTRDDIIRMGQEAGFVVAEWGKTLPCLERFAALVATAATEEANRRANASWSLMCEKMVLAEREACAKVCDLEAALWEENSDGQVSLRSVAAVIRARGNT